MSPRKRQAESIIVSQIRELLKIMRVPHFKHVAGPIGEYGISDIIGVLPGSGRAFFCEVKTPKGKANDEQIAFLDRMRAAGAIAIVVHSAQEMLTRLADSGFEPARRINTQMGGGPNA